MNRDNVQEQLRAAAETFVDQVVALFGEALSGIAQDLHVDVRQGVAPQRRIAIRAAVPAARPAAAPERTGRRSGDELQHTAERVVQLLSGHTDGMRIEQINRELGTDTRELMRPIKMLLDGNRIRKSGQRRATTYFSA